MGVFDRFTSWRRSIGSDKQPKHVVDEKMTKDVKNEKKEKDRKERDALKKQFQAVGSVGKKEAKEESTQKESSTPGKKSTTKKKGPSETGDAHRILVRPMVTEKSSLLMSANQYVFLVAPDAHTKSVADAVRRVYGVTPQDVRMQNVRGKAVRHGRSTGMTRHWKKAVVQLKEGETIDVAEGT